MKMRVLFYSLSIFFITLLTSNVVHAQADCKEEKVGKSYFSICPGNIVTEKKKLLLTTKALPKRIDNKNTFKVVHYYVADRRKVETDEVFLEYSKFLKNLETHDLYINGKEFTGILKIALPFKNEGVSTQYGGYDLLTYEFKEGKFVTKSKANDVELEKEKAVVRPT